MCRIRTLRKRGDIQGEKNNYMYKMIFLYIYTYHYEFKDENE